MGAVPVAPGDASGARSRLLAACEGYLDFATGNPGLYRAVFYSNEQIDELTAPTERARGSAGEGGYNLLIAALQDVVTATVGTSLDPWDPLAVWSACHGLAMLRLDAARRSLPDEEFARARDRVLARSSPPCRSKPWRQLGHRRPPPAPPDRPLTARSDESAH